MKKRKSHALCHVAWQASGYMAEGKWGQRKSKKAQSTKVSLVKLLARIPNKKKIEEPEKVMLF